MAVDLGIEGVRLGPSHDVPDVVSCICIFHPQNLEFLIRSRST